jgi:hypothetical protein
VNSPQETQLGHELRQLVSGQPFTPDIEAIGLRARQRHRRGLALRGATAAGAAVLAAGGLLAAVHGTGGTAAGPTAGPTASRAPAVNSRLMSLAALIKARSGPLPGNASLVIEKQVIGGKPMQAGYGLYTDSGDMYSGDDKQTLVAAVAQHANLADFTNAREIAAARYAAAGDLATARVRMVNALPNDFFLSFAARKKIWAEGAAARQALMREKGIKAPLKMPTGKALQGDIDNSLWTASTIALSWGAGDPEIREGVLRLVSTIPEVTVASSATGGQPTLTITAGPEVFGGDGEQVLTINARTGMPISSVVTGRGMPTSVETFRVSRVTLADIKAGKF